MEFASVVLPILDTNVCELASPVALELASAIDWSQADSSDPNQSFSNNTYGTRALVRGCITAHRSLHISPFILYYFLKFSPCIIIFQSVDF